MSVSEDNKPDVDKTLKPIIPPAHLIPGLLDGSVTLLVDVLEPQPAVSHLAIQCAHIYPNGTRCELMTRKYYCHHHLRETLGERYYLAEEWAVTYAKDPCEAPEISSDPVPIVWYRIDKDGTVRQEPSSGWRGRWRPPETMPEWASRATIDILDVQVKRLMDACNIQTLEQMGLLRNYDDCPFSAWDAHHPVGQRWSDKPWCAFSLVKVESK